MEDSGGQVQALGRIKQAILKLPSATYIKERMKPGMGKVPSQWEEKLDHAELYLSILYDDYLAASSELLIFELLILGLQLLM